MSRIPDEFIEQRAEEFLSLEINTFTTFESYLNFYWHAKNAGDKGHLCNLKSFKRTALRNDAYVIH